MTFAGKTQATAKNIEHLKSGEIHKEIDDNLPLLPNCGHSTSPHLDIPSTSYELEDFGSHPVSPNVTSAVDDPSILECVLEWQQQQFYDQQ